MRRRKQIRLREYDYSQPGAYFITICTKDRIGMFGKIVDGDMIMHEYGNIVQLCWNVLPDHYDNIQLDEFVVMPNHIHGIIIINDDAVGAGLRPAPTGNNVNPKRHGLSEIIRAFKSFSARRINEFRHTPCAHVWQRGYYDHIIRNVQALNRIREYISTNPERWQLDRENPDRFETDEFDMWLRAEGKRNVPVR